jgi:hypothetical protein
VRPRPGKVRACEKRAGSWCRRPLRQAKRRKGRRARENRRALRLLAIGQTGWLGAQRSAAPRPARFKRSEGRAGAQAKPHGLDRGHRPAPAPPDRETRRRTAAQTLLAALGVALCVYGGLRWHAHYKHGRANAGAYAFEFTAWQSPKCPPQALRQCPQSFGLARSVGTDCGQSPAWL